MTFFTFVFVILTANLRLTVAAPAVTYDQQQTGDLNVQVHLKDIQIIALLDSEMLGDYGDYDYAYDYSDFTIKPITPHTTTTAPAPVSTSATSTSSVEPWHTWPTISSGSSTPPTVLQSGGSEVGSGVAVPLSPPKPVEDAAKADPEKNDSPAVITKASDDKTSSVALPEPQTELATRLLTDKSEADDLHSGEKDAIEDVLAVKPEESSSSAQENPASVTEPEKNSETPVEQPQQQVSKKCIPGYGRDQKGRCNRLHLRRRVPSALLPFGIRLTPRVYQKRDQLRSETSEN